MGVWRERERQTVGDYRIFRVERSVAESPADGSAHTFYRILSADWAQIVPVTPAGEIVMIRVFRHGSGRTSLEVPGGLVEPGEEPAATAARECLEETGYRADDVRPLAALNPNPALFANTLHAFCAFGVVAAAPIRNDPTEHTEVVLVPRSDLRPLLRSGAVDHALIAATLWQFLDRYG
ncbi:MAG TPA: NUDIX hydrolase [Gammaproteobacteria bacterium]